MHVIIDRKLLIYMLFDLLRIWPSMTETSLSIDHPSIIEMLSLVAHCRWSLRSACWQVENLLYFTGQNWDASCCLLHVRCELANSAWKHVQLHGLQTSYCVHWALWMGFDPQCRESWTCYFLTCFACSLHKFTINMLTVGEEQ